MDQKLAGETVTEGPGPAMVGIRLEDKSVWERRVPLVPADIDELQAGHGLGVVVQPSENRIYPDTTFSEVGATVQMDLSAADVIFAVKEVPIPLLLDGKTYCFFAHVIKGQRYNMPLLRTLLDKGITLIDYERITDAQGHRLVKFGLEAGQAGMIDSLYVLGRRLLMEGVPNPFSQIKQAYTYRDLAHAEQVITEAGQSLKSSGLNLPDGPLVVGFTGRGSVSQGAQEVFDLLPHEIVEPADLPAVMDRKVRDRIFKVVFDKRHLARPIEAGRPFVETEYHQHPERFEARFQEYLPYLTVLMNGIFWTEDYPKFVTKVDVQKQWLDGHRRLRVIGDVTCDIDGAVELTYKPTQPDQPTYIYDPETDAFVDGLIGSGIAVLAVDNLPCELSRDASDNFSRSLRDFVPAIAKADYSQPFDELELPKAVLRAIITHRGKLTPEYRYLHEALASAGLMPAKELLDKDGSSRGAGSKDGP